MEELSKEADRPVHYVGFWRRVLMGLVEMLVMSIPFVFLYRTSINISVSTGSIIPFIIYWILLYSFLIFMVVRYGGTPGKLIMKARIVNEEGNYISLSKAIVRMGFYIVNSLVLVLILQEAITAHIDKDLISKFFNDYEGQYYLLRTLLGFVILIDGLYVLINKKKRALHDLLAGSYVKDKGSVNK